MKIWLDDIREPPDENWTWCKNGREFRDMIDCHWPDEISFDHDLAHIEFGHEITGYTCLCWVEKRVMTQTHLPIPKMRVHTMNAAVRQKMQKTIDKLERLRQTEFDHYEGRVTE